MVFGCYSCTFQFHIIILRILKRVLVRLQSISRDSFLPCLCFNSGEIFHNSVNPYRIAFINAAIFGKEKSMVAEGHDAPDDVF